MFQFLSFKEEVKINLFWQEWVLDNLDIDWMNDSDELQTSQNTFSTQRFD